MLLDAIISGPPYSNPLLLLSAAPSAYTGTILKLMSQRPLSADYNFITAHDVHTDDSPIFALRGDGVVDARQLTVRSGIRTSISATAIPADVNLWTPLDAAWIPVSTVPPMGVVRIYSEIAQDHASADDYNLLNVQTRATTASATPVYNMFQVRGDGKTTINRGDMTINDNPSSPIVTVRLASGTLCISMQLIHARSDWAQRRANKLEARERIAARALTVQRAILDCLFLQPPRASMCTLQAHFQAAW
ncbi:MAG: hypothetical protein EOO65_01395 [Methanosarcinales archaeon]|nr:MAG: hypothetical protein EOO65_01395 [Methanosarcinales archaeon]